MIKYKGRTITVAKAITGYAFQVKRGKKEVVADGYCRPWTARRGAMRMIDRKEA